MVQLAAMIASQAIGEYRVMTGAALAVGVTPVELTEIVYRAVPYVGMVKVLDFLHVTTDVLTGRGVELPLPGQSTTTPEARYVKGLRQVHLGGRSRAPERTPTRRCMSPAASRPSRLPRIHGREAKYGERIDGAKLNYEAATKVTTMGLPTGRDTPPSGPGPGPTPRAPGSGCATPARLPRRSPTKLLRPCSRFSSTCAWGAPERRRQAP